MENGEAFVPLHSSGKQVPAGAATGGEQVEPFFAPGSWWGAVGLSFNRKSLVLGWGAPFQDFLLIEDVEHQP